MQQPVVVSNDLLKFIYEPVLAEIGRSEEQLSKILSDSPLPGLGLNLIGSGGKRLRPALVLLSASFGARPTEEAIKIAAAVEILHLATLVHDDIIDCSTHRRGLPTINARLGDAVAILAGDYCYAHFLSLMSSCRETILRSLSNVLLDMIRGEFYQRAASYDTHDKKEGYLRRVAYKSASFLANCCLLGAQQVDTRFELAASLKLFGYSLGIAFQISDDLLDFCGDPDRLGKPTGLDLSTGVQTLPIIYALERGSRADDLRNGLVSGNYDENFWALLHEQLTESQALIYTRKVIEHYLTRARNCLRILPDCPAKNSLKLLTEYISNRDH